MFILLSLIGKLAWPFHKQWVKEQQDRFEAMIIATLRAILTAIPRLRQERQADEADPLLVPENITRSLSDKQG